MLAEAGGGDEGGTWARVISTFVKPRAPQGSTNASSAAAAGVSSPRWHPTSTAASGNQAPIDTSALVAQHASEAAATAAALQQQLESAGINLVGSGNAAFAPAAAAAAAEAAADAAAAAAAVAAMVGPAGAAAPTSATAAAMVSINICSTALAALAPRATDLGALNDEFSSILDDGEDLFHRCLEGAAAANAAKNRYVNIIPYDANRVPLDPAEAAAAAAQAAAQAAAAAATAVGAAAAGRRRLSSLFEDAVRGSSSSSNYFNGSFIKDPTVDGTYACGYVATQGPLPSTVPDFWQAMRVAQCSAVVMLTNYVDFGRAKCAPYFPEQEGAVMALAGGLNIQCVHKTQLSSDLTIRQLEVSYPPNGEERQWINHYHYTSWPDHGVPPSTSGVRALCHALDDCRRAGCHIAVHCSAGVGRTGAFVAIDMLLQRLQRLRVQPPGAISADAVRAAVDVRTLVLALRRQRRGMVQTGGQYEFVYHALVDDLKDGIAAGQAMLLEEAEAEREAAAAARSSRGRDAAGDTARPRRMGSGALHH